MNSSSRVSTHTHKSKKDTVDKRITTLEALLQEVLSSRGDMEELERLREALPEITQTQRSLKDLQRGIDSCSKSLLQIQSTSEKHNLNTQYSSVSRSLKTCSKNISQLRQSIQTLNSVFPQLRKSRKVLENKELEGCKGSIHPLLERHRKEMTNVLKRMEEECLGVELRGVNKEMQERIGKEVARKRKEWGLQLKGLNQVLGGLKCRAQFIKDRDTKIKVEERLGELLLNEEVEDKSIALSMAEQEIQLEGIAEFTSQKVPQVVEELRVIESQLGIVGEWLKSPIGEEERQHLEREITYLKDRWFNMRNKLHAIRKKYLLDMREGEDRLMAVVDKTQAPFRKRLKDLETSIRSLNEKVEMKLGELDVKEKQLHRKYIALLNSLT